MSSCAPFLFYLFCMCDIYFCMLLATDNGSVSSCRRHCSDKAQKRRANRCRSWLDISDICNIYGSLLIPTGGVTPLAPCPLPFRPAPKDHTHKWIAIFTALYGNLLGKVVHSIILLEGLSRNWSIAGRTEYWIQCCFYFKNAIDPHLRFIGFRNWFFSWYCRCCCCAFTVATFL